MGKYMERKAKAVIAILVAVTLTLSVMPMATFAVDGDAVVSDVKIRIDWSRVSQLQEGMGKNELPFVYNRAPSNTEGHYVIADCENIKLYGYGWLVNLSDEREGQLSQWEDIAAVNKTINYTDSYAFGIKIVLNNGFVFADKEEITLSGINGYGYVDYVNGSSAGFIVELGTLEDIQNVLNHNHPICGATHTDSGEHMGNCEDINWTAWDGTNEISYDADTKTANIYIFEDAFLTDTITVADGYTLNLCLNGKVLNGSLLNEFDEIVRVSDYGTLNLCDCGTETYKFTPDSTGKWMLDEENGTQTVTGGVITGGNYCAIRTDGTTTIYGGNITGNHSTFHGNVYANSDKLAVYGGSICGNTSSEEFGAGVYVQMGDIHISGDVEIYDNKHDNKASNLYFDDSYKLIVNGPLNNVKPIGVCYGDFETVFAEPDGINVTDLTAYADKFISEMPGYYIDVNDEKQLALVAYSFIQQPAKDNDYTVKTNRDDDVKSYSWYSYLLSDELGEVISGQTTNSFSDGEGGKQYVAKVIFGDNSELISAPFTVIGTMTGISAQGFSGNYDGNAHGITVTAPEGSTLKYGTTAGVYNMTTSPTITNVGNLTVYYQVTKDGFETVTGAATVIISKADPGYTAPNQKESLTYNGSYQELVDEGTATNGDMQYALGDNNTIAPTSGWSDTIPTGKDAGTYYVWYKVVGDTNYQNVNPVCNTVKVEKATLTADSFISRGNVTGIYDGQQRVFDVVFNTYQDRYSGVGNVTVKYYDVNGTLLDGAPKHAGSYTYKIDVTEGNNYKAAQGIGSDSWSFTIIQRNIHILPDAMTKTYGESDPENFTYTASGLVSGEVLSGALARDAGENAGTYAITQGTLTSVNNPNYNIIFEGADFVIEKADQAALDITGKPNGDITYGDIFTLSTTGGSGDGVITWEVTVGSEYVEVDSSTGKVSVKGVGTVRLTATKAEGTNHKAATATLEFTTVKETPVIGPVVVSGDVKDTTKPADVVLTGTNTSVPGTLKIVKAGEFMQANKSVYYWEFVPEDTDNYNVVTGDVQIDVQDTNAPFAVIKIDTNEWKEFFNDITFGLFFKDIQDVEITYTDNENGSGLKDILYYVADHVLCETELATVEWKAYTEKFGINPNGEYVIYAKASDNDGNVVVINSNGIIVDATVPVLNGITDGETYYGDKTFKVVEDYLDTLEVDGVDVTAQINGDGEYKIVADNNEHSIRATDKSGNVTEYVIMVYMNYIVSFKDGDTILSTEIVGHGKDATLPKIPEKEGYDQTAPTWDKDGKNITADTEINAVYTINEYTITFMGENGVYMTMTYKHGDVVKMPDVPAKDGYTVKWETTIDKATGNATIKVVYTENSTENPSYPQTGDNSNLWLWMALAFINGGLLFKTLIMKKKEQV